MAADDRINGARNIRVLNSLRTFRNSVGSKDKNDYFKFSLSGRSSFKLSLDKLQDNVNVSLIQEGQVLASSKRLGKKPEAIASTLEAGTYHIRVYRQSGESKYRLKLSAALLSSETLPPGTLPSTSRRFLSTGDARVGSITPTTGVFSATSGSGTQFTDLASSPTGDLFGITFSSLYKIDPNTGASTLVGGLGTFGMNALGFAPSGVLYAAGGSRFYTVNPATGDATLVADIPTFTSSGDLVYDAASGRLLATSINGSTDTLFSIGVNGDAQVIGDVGFSNIWGLFFDNGTLYGYTSDQKQIAINPTTGAGTFDRTITGASGSVLGAT